MVSKPLRVNGAIVAGIPPAPPPYNESSEVAPYKATGPGLSQRLCKVTPGNSGHGTTPDVFRLDAAKSTREQPHTVKLGTRDVPSITFL